MDRREFLRAAAALPPAALLAGTHPASAATDAGSGALALVGLSGASRPVPVIGRRAWGALPHGDGVRRHVPRRLTVHHMAERVTDRTQAPATVRGIQRYHMRDLDHPDIDYHFLVDRSGFVYQGRSPRFVGDTQTEYDPTGHFLVCCLGDYQGGTRPAQHPTPAMLRSLARLLAWASQRWDIPLATIAGHRDYASTTCPGRELYTLIRDGTLRAMTRESRQSGTLELDVLRGRRGRRLVHRIEAGMA